MRCLLVLAVAAACLGVACRPAATADDAPPPVSGETHPPPSRDVRDPWRDAQARGIEFRAVGQEPGWFVEIDGRGMLRLVYDYGEREAVAPVAPAAVEQGRTIYRSTTDAQAVVVSIAERPCGDAMSGQPFPSTVTVTVAGRALHGCGRALGADGDWSASAGQIGPVRIGMTIEEAEAALGAPFEAPGDSGDCLYRRTPAAPQGVLFMQVAGRIVRIDLTAFDVRTGQGVGVGDSEARIHDAYGSTAYMFRGLRRDDTRVVMWPFVEAAADLFRGTDGVKNVTLHLGTWNSLHTGVTGFNNGNGKLWYESDLYGTLGVRFGPDVTVAATYTAYMSPNNSFTSIKELAFKAAVDDAGSAGVALRPYGLVAFELDTLPGVRQADRGVNAGTYLEAGIAPGWVDPDFRIEFPIKVGISLDDYYELAGVDQRFGFLSLAAIGTVPIARSNAYGSWNVHGGVEFLSLGNTPEAFNAGDQTKLVASIGIGFSY